MTTTTKPKLMLCMGEHEWLGQAPLRCFEPGDGGLVCVECGWEQSSVAGGCAELCLAATWHDFVPKSQTAAQYEHLASIARNGGFQIPIFPPHRTATGCDFKVGDRVQVRLHGPGPGGPASNRPRDVNNYKRFFTRVVDGEVMYLPGERYQHSCYAVKFKLSEDNFDDWQALMPDFVVEQKTQADQFTVGEDWIDYEIEPSAIESLTTWRA